MHRRTIIGAVATTAALALPGVAGAHVTVAPAGDVPPEGYGKVDFRVPHGCDGSPTASITVQLPDTVVGATPQIVPGWDVTTKEGPLAAPVEAHGEQITEGVREVTWSGGSLPDDRLQEFGLSIQTAGGRAGEKAYFKILQECEEGETAWAEIPQGDEEPEAPAAELTFAEAAGGPGAEATAEAVPASTVTPADVEAKASEGLAIAGLVVGALGLLAGGAALAFGGAGRPRRG